MRFTLTLLILLSCGAAAAQGPPVEYGKPEEMRGLTRVFIDTGGDVESRDRIAKEIEKAKLGLTLLDSAEGAEVVLLYKNAKERDAEHSTVNVGAGRICVVRGDRLRVVASFQDEEGTVFEKKPATNFGKAFVKVYRKANR